MNSAMYRLTRLSQICITATAVCLTLNATILVSDIWMLWFTQQIETVAISEDRIEALSTSFDAAVNVINIGLFTVFLAASILNAIWLYRATANAAKLVPTQERMSPGYAIGCYFIPILSLFKPFQAMKELVNSSFGDGRKLSAPLPLRFTVWWACWVISNILAGVTGRAMDSAVELVDIKWVTLFTVVENVLYTAAGLIFISIIREVSAAQDNRTETSAEVFE